MNNNGFDYIDLGLPSGTLWATCNVGADKLTDYGLYFQWGDIKGYAKDEIGIKTGQKKFASDWSDYKFGIFPKFTMYRRHTCSKLDLKDDAARFNMGGSWHMPSSDQIQELINHTTHIWTTLNGVNGRLFVSKKDTSKSIFFQQQA